MSRRHQHQDIDINHHEQHIFRLVDHITFRSINFVEQCLNAQRDISPTGHGIADSQRVFRAEAAGVWFWFQYASRSPHEK